MSARDRFGGRIPLRGLLAAALVAAVASSAVPATPSAQHFEASGGERSFAENPATGQIPIGHSFNTEQHPGKHERGYISIHRERAFAFIRPGKERARYFCLGERVHTRLLRRAERAVNNLPGVVEGRAMPETTEQQLWLWAQRRELWYFADQETAAKPPRAIRKFITRLHRLLDPHRDDSARAPDDGTTRCGGY